ncbi:MAG: CdaR family protein [Butyricicoccus sp.]|nr:CdaR family protein [Butyricicoccus sp.]
MNFLKQHNVFLKILSLFIAVFLWSYVVLTDNPPKTQTFPNLAVQTVGIENLEERDLTVVTTEEPKITLKITGTSKDMAQLSVNDIKAEVDLSNIQEAGVYYIQPTVTIDKDTDSISFEPRRLQINVENVISKDVPVRVTTMNNLDKDQLVGELTPSQKTIQITGAESVVSTVGYALLTVDLDNISKNMAQTCRVALYTNDDTLVDSSLVTLEKESLDVTVGVNHVVTLPLRVSLISSASLTSDMVESTISPASVRVYGDKEIVSALTSLSLGSIDLSQIEKDGQQVKLSIKLPEGVHLMEGEPKQATVQVTMKDDITRTVAVSAIELEDTSGEAEKPITTLNTTSVNVDVVGKADAVSKVTAENIQVKASFDSSALGAGTHEVPAQVTVEADGVTAKTEEVTVSITIVAQEEEEEGS